MLVTAIEKRILRRWGTVPASEFGDERGEAIVLTNYLRQH
jgi:hypothetical protein